MTQPKLSDSDKQAALAAFNTFYADAVDRRISIVDPPNTHQETWLRAWQIATQAAYERAAQLLEQNVVDTNHRVLLEALPYPDAVRHTFAEAIRNLAKGE